MKIGHNLMAANAIRNTNANSGTASKSMEKLSSGLAITTAADDAAGLAISEKMKGQIRGLSTASNNAQDAVSLVQTADGALTETTSILQRMRELANQSSNDTNTAADRTAIQTETDQLVAQLDNIATSTQFNTKNLLDGSMGRAVNTAVANISTSSVVKAGGAAATITALATALQDANGNSLGILSGDTITVSYSKAGSLVTNTITVTAVTTISSSITMADGTLTATAGQMVATATTAGFSTSINGLTVTVKDSTGTIRTAATNALSSFAETTAAADIRQDGTATIQIGANTGQNIGINVDNMSGAALGVEGLKVGTQAQANVAIRVIDAATAKVSTARAQLGAYQNRLQSTINNLGTTAENLTSAQSQVTDVDMASEMAEFSKNNVLSQAAQAMLAQANQQPQQVLQLLK